METKREDGYYWARIPRFNPDWEIYYYKAEYQPCCWSKGDFDFQESDVLEVDERRIISPAERSSTSTAPKSDDHVLAMRDGKVVSLAVTTIAGPPQICPNGGRIEIPAEKWIFTV